MINELTFNDVELKDNFNSNFSSLYSYDINDDFNNNSFTKYFIYEEKCNIIGFVNYYDLYDRFEIANIYVDPVHRNQKIASRLMEKVIEVGEEKDITNITLEVRKDNEIAIKLYEKYDFIVVSTRERYYKGVDGLLMERKMK